MRYHGEVPGERDCSLSKCRSGPKVYLEKSGREKLVPGFDFTNEQLFFIGYGHGRCGKDTLDSLRRMIKRNDHSPYRAR